jgi:hypothetical protein
MKRFTLAFAAAALLLLAGTALAQIKPITVIGPGVGAGRTTFFQQHNLTLNPDSVYVLTGIYFVAPGYSLTIPAGTVILGDSAATLVVSPGAQIFATGTALNPIVFTSAKPVGERRAGDWGGVILLGNAPTNQTNPLIEGGIIPGSYGGTNPADNSGIFRYVRIEFCGYRFQKDNEVNGLTMGGVGNGTTIEYVQLSYSNDDGFEWFGGTVNGKYLITFGETDDGFDTDFGFVGNVQFGFGLKDPNVWDPTDASRAIESDNCGNSSCYGTSPRTNPVFSNMTLVGPKRTNATTIPAGDRFDYGLMFRRGTQQNLLNSAVVGYERSMSFRDVETYNSIDHPSYTNEAIRVRNTSFASFVGTVDSVETSGTGVDKANVNAWLNRQGNTWNAASRQPDVLLLTNMSNLNAPNPVPATGSELIGAGTNFTGLPGFFTPTSYRGAFDPSLTMANQWTASWTDFNPQTRVYNIPANATYNLHNAGWNIVSVPTFVAADSTVNTIFPGTTGTTVYGFNGTSYNSIPGTGTVSTGAAYWAYWPTSRATYTQGVGVETFKITVNQEGWVLIGGINGTVRDLNADGDADVVTSPTGRILAGDVWGYNGSTYETVNQMNPGRGYWVYVTGGSFPVDITVTKNF